MSDETRGYCQKWPNFLSVTDLCRGCDSGTGESKYFQRRHVLCRVPGPGLLICMVTEKNTTAIFISEQKAQNYVGLCPGLSPTPQFWVVMVLTYKIHQDSKIIQVAKTKAWNPFLGGMVSHWWGEIISAKLKLAHGIPKLYIPSGFIKHGVLENGP